jgi:transposase-like protein
MNHDNPLFRKPIHRPNENAVSDQIIQSVAFGLCPACESENVSWRGYNTDMVGDGLLLNSATCADCNHTWEEIFTVTLSSVEFPNIQEQA